MRARKVWLVLISVAVCGVAAVSAVFVRPIRTAVIDALPQPWVVELGALRHGFDVDTDVRIEMPDGTMLVASVYLPGRKWRWPLPTVLIRLPYRRLHYREALSSASEFAENGFAVVIQDLRGTGDSGGELLPWRDVAEDGAATLDWIANQRWSNGAVGTFGCSALGETQLILGKINHPAHRAIVASGAGGAVGSAASRYSYFGVYEGGVFQLASAFGWFVLAGSKDPKAGAPPPFDTTAVLRRLPVADLVKSVRADANGYNDYVRTPLGDPGWERWGYLSERDRVDVPSMIINTWGDQTVGDALAFAEVNRTRGGGSSQKVIVAAGNHCNHAGPGTRFGDLSLADAEWPYIEWSIAWFNHWLRDPMMELPVLPAYRYFMLVENRWHDADAWPPLDAELQRWYLGSEGSASTRDGNGVLSPAPSSIAASDSLIYDPSDPVPSRGGPVCCTGMPNERSGPIDQSEVEQRRDVLVYTSAVLDRDLPIAGPLRASLSVSSSALDTDVVARLVDVWPDGRAINIQEGALRVRYRDGFVEPKLMAPGTRYDVVVDMRSIAYLVQKGHRLRLDVTSSSFPRLERNLNGGGSNNAEETEPVIATNTVHYAGASYITIPVLAGGAAAK